MVVDGGNVVLQVFSAEGRAYYDLDRKWAFTKIEEYEPMNSIHSTDEIVGRTTESGVVFERGDDQDSEEDEN
jgi:hypothetical protein